ncbi:MAG: Gmad2 immunoglobulin-like domain-containing protein [Marmoricola sp.]
MTTPTDDSDLHGLLDDAVADVRPRGGPEDIRERAVRPSAARWVPLTVAAAAATVLVIGGAAWLAQSQPDRSPTASPVEPQASATTQASAKEPPPRTASVLVYYAGDTANGSRLYAEQRQVPDVTGTDLQVAVDEALNSQPLDADYDPWPVSGLTATATAANGVITIDLSGFSAPTGNLDDADARVAMQALVWTADAATKSTMPVQFLVDGKPSDTVLATDVAAPVAPTSADSTLAAVQVTSPTEGATVPTQFEVTGTASTFEANVVWELKQGDQTVRNGFTTAQQCCTLSPYSFTVTAPPGTYTLVVHDTDESDGEGVGITQDTKTITVQ